MSEVEGNLRRVPTPVNRWPPHLLLSNAGGPRTQKVAEIDPKVLRVLSDLCALCDLGGYS